MKIDIEIYISKYYRVKYRVGNWLEICVCYEISLEFAIDNEIIIFLIVN